MNKYGFKPTEWQEMLQIFTKNNALEKVVIFGSRAKNTFKPMSDVDIAVYGNLRYADISQLEADLEDSNLPFLFDVVQYASIQSEELLEHIRRYGDAIYLKGWEEYKYTEIANIIGGGTPKTNIPSYWDGDIPWLSVKDFANNNKYVYSSEKNITNKGLVNSSTKLLEKGDIILSARGTIGELAMIPFKMSFNQSCFGLRANKKVDNHFLYYLTKTKIKELKSNSYGSVFNTITKITFDNIICEIPPLPEQKSIAAVLSSLDDKIELLQEENKTLEETAQTLFKEWFGKYQLGDELPEGWRIGKLGDEFNITIGRTPPRKEKEWFSKNQEDYKWASIKDIVHSNMYILQTTESLTPKAVKKFNIPIILENTVILSFKMTVGKLAITTEKMLSNEAIAHFNLKKDPPLNSELLYLYLKNLDFNSLGSTSSIVTAINSTIIKNINIIIPDKLYIDNINRLILPLFKKIKLNIQEISTLQTTRDTLLPKLMDGSIRVNDLEA